MARPAQRHTIGAVTLYQRKQHWHASYTVNGLRTRQALKVTNLKAAQEKAREIDELIQLGEYTTLQDLRQYKDITFSAFVEDFKAKYKGWSAATAKGNNGLLDRLIEEWGDRPLSSLNARLIEGYRARRLDEGITAATTNRYLAVIKVLFKMAVRWGIVTHNPAQQVTMLKEESHIPIALTERQVEAGLRK